MQWHVTLVEMEMSNISSIGLYYDTSFITKKLLNCIKDKFPWYAISYYYQKPISYEIKIVESIEIFELSNYMLFVE